MLESLSALQLEDGKRIISAYAHKTGELMSKPHILITNDDGVFAPGIKHLCKSLHEIAEVTVVAPLSEQSAVGLGLTIRAPLRVEKIEWAELRNVYGVSGTPADCVKLAISTLLEEKPALIVSGINKGGNSGRNLLYSGTVAGAIEGVMQGIPSAAFSCFEFKEPNYAIAEAYIASIVRYLLEHLLPEGSLLNVNFPERTYALPKGIKMTRQGRQLWRENPDKCFHPIEGHTYYWLGAKLHVCEEEEDCDISWLNKGYITAVPVHVAELTDHHHLENHRHHFEATLNES